MEEEREGRERSKKSEDLNFKLLICFVFFSCHASLGFDSCSRHALKTEYFVNKMSDYLSLEENSF